MGNSHLYKQWKSRLTFMLFVTPASLFLMLFWLVPIAAAIGISFTDWDYMTSGFQMTGWANYQGLLKDKAFWEALSHTLLFAAQTVVPVLVLGLILALLVWSAGRNTIYSLILFSPWITPAVAVSIVWTWIFEPDAGLANQLLHMLGLPGFAWLHSSDTALSSVALVTVWKNLGYVMLLLPAPYPECRLNCRKLLLLTVREASGGFLHITLPLLRPTILMTGIIMTADSLRAYDQIQILTQGGPAGSTRTLLYLYYQLGFEQFDMGRASAAVVILMAIGLGLSLFQIQWKKKEVYI